MNTRQPGFFIIDQHVITSENHFNSEQNLTTMMYSALEHFMERIGSEYYCHYQLKGKLVVI